MATMRASSQRLCQMVHGAGLRHGTVDRLHTVLATGWWMAAVDARYDSQLDQMIVRSTNRFTVVKKLADDFDVSLQPTRPGSATAATLTGHYGNNLFDALVALRLPAFTPENVHLEVALTAQRLAQQDTIDIITHVYAEIVHQDYYMQEEDDRTLAFLDRRATLHDTVQKHVELAANAAAPHTSVGDPVH